MAGVRQFDEEAVLGTVLDVFWRKGWERTSMSDLADAAGVQRGSLYNAYGGKQELFLLVFENYADRFLSQTRQALDAETAEQALRRFLEMAIANITSGRPARGCLTTKTAAEAAGVEPKIMARLRRLMEALRATLAEALSAPHLRAGLAIEPAEAAQMLVTFTRGLAVMERIYKDADGLRETADLMVRLMLKPQPQGAAAPRKRIARSQAG